jgi:hypothetical protein
MGLKVVLYVIGKEVKCNNRVFFTHWYSQDVAIWTVDSHSEGSELDPRSDICKFFILPPSKIMV